MIISCLSSALRTCVAEEDLSHHAPVPTVRLMALKFQPGVFYTVCGFTLPIPLESTLRYRNRHFVGVSRKGQFAGRELPVVTPAYDLHFHFVHDRPLLSKALALCGESVSAQVHVTPFVGARSAPSLFSADREVAIRSILPVMHLRLKRIWSQRVAPSHRRVICLHQDRVSRRSARAPLRLPPSGEESACTICGADSQEGPEKGPPEQYTLVNGALSFDNRKPSKDLSIFCLRGLDRKSRETLAREGMPREQGRFLRSTPRPVTASTAHRA